MAPLDVNFKPSNRDDEFLDLRSISDGKPTAIVIGGGFAGLAAARSLQKEFKVILLEARDRVGGRVHTSMDFGFPVDLGASWLHGLSDDNPLTPIVKRLQLPLYRTSEDNSVLYDHDLESFALYDELGGKVDPRTVASVGHIFEQVLEETKEVRKEHPEDTSLERAMSLVFERRPDLRQEGVAKAVLQWYICRLEGWFAADIGQISAQQWDSEEVLDGGHGLLVNGYAPLVEVLSEGLDIYLNHRVCEIEWLGYGVRVTTEDRKSFSADGAIVTVPHGVLKANLITFIPKLPDWKQTAIDDTGVGCENKVALLFKEPFWSNVEFLGIVAPTPYECSYFLNLHKATGNPVLVYMPAGSLASDLETLADEEVISFVMRKLHSMFPNAPVTEPLQYEVTRWGTDQDSLGCYTYDAVGIAHDNADALGRCVGPLFFAGEATSAYMGTVHGAYESGLRAAEECRELCAERYMALKLLPLDASCAGDDADDDETEVLPLMVSRL